MVTGKAYAGYRYAQPECTIMTGRRVHGHSRSNNGKTTRTFNTWLAMRQRCHDPKSTNYHKYGAKGVKVCARWRKSFSAFLEDMGERPDGKTLDRKNGEKGYYPDNCRWSTPKEQNENRKRGRNANSEKTSCPKGHPYSGSNLTFGSAGNRRCRICVNEGARRRRLESRP